MKSRLYKQILLLITMYFLIGCKAESLKETNVTVVADNSGKKANQYIDDTYYVPDIFGILMLCEGDELTEYKENVQLLKGDKESVEKAIENLSAMEQTPAVLNAMGVGLLRLDRCDEGKERLNEALSLTENNLEEVCILNNLGNPRLHNPENLVNNNLISRFEQALEKESDPIRKIIIRMNKIVYGPFLYLDEEDPINYTLEEFEQLLKDEEGVLGSNQIVGIYAYPILFLFLTENEEEEIQYLEEALRMNRELYQYRAADILSYQGLMGMYHAMGEHEKALEYADKFIETVEGFLSDTDTYLVISYYDKTGILIKEKRYDEALQCINILLGKQELRQEDRAKACLKLGELYYVQDDFSKAEETVKEAYNIFRTEKGEDRVTEIDIDEILEIYQDADYYDSNPDYMEWLKGQLENL